jgi:hypothetical protein
MIDRLLGAAAAAPIEALGTLFDRLFTSDAERAQAQAVLEKLKAHPAELQVELNKIEAAHRSVFVAGWRPFIGWICGAALAWHFIGHPLLAWANALFGQPPAIPPLLDDGALMELVLALLGLSGLRTFEKVRGRAG